MHFVRPALFAFLAVSVLAAQDSGTESPDGLAILQQMSEHYAAAKSWYIEATKERTSETKYSRGWSKTVIIAAVHGNKYRYEGHSEMGSAVHLSDGKTAWDLHTEERAYKQQPAPPNGYQVPREWQMNEQAAMEAVRLREDFAKFAGHYISATRLPDQTTTEIPCYVVRVTTAQRKGPKTEGFSHDETLWIDKATRTVRKTIEHEDTFLYAGSAHIPIVEDTVVTHKTG